MRTVLLLLLLMVHLPATSDYYPDNATEIPLSEPTQAEKAEYLPMTTPRNSGAVAYMFHTAITNIGSVQWELQQQATTDDHGYRRIGDSYMVAVAKYYGSVGEKLRITYEDSSVITAIIGDLKQTIHTKSKYFGLDGSLLEFIVDKGAWNHNNIDRFRGEVVSIEREV